MSYYDPQFTWITVSFSGGRSSDVMTKRLIERYRNSKKVKIVVIFANTGCEREATLKFVHLCEKFFRFPVVWVEAVVDPREGFGVRHKVVDYSTASRNGEPFESAVAKYGIFNRTSPGCTARLKTEPMESYLKSKGFKFRKHFGVNHFTAIGIRADEIDRVSTKRNELKIMYPLADMGLTKRDIAIEIKKWPFDLELPSDAYGNCQWCWKKTKRKHLTLMREAPDVFEFPERMERLYGHVKADMAAGHNGRRYWFKGHETVNDLRIQALNLDFTLYVDDPHLHAKDYDPDLDTGGSCGDSCEIGADD